MPAAPDDPSFGWAGSAEQIGTTEFKRSLEHRPGSSLIAVLHLLVRKAGSERIVRSYQ